MNYIITAGIFLGALVVGVVTAVLTPVKPVAEFTGTVLHVASEQIPSAVSMTIDGVERVFDLIPTESVSTGDPA